MRESANERCLRPRYGTRLTPMTRVSGLGREIWERLLMSISP